jgi:hypothetical protein
VLVRCGRIAAIALELAAALGFWQIVELPFSFPIRAQVRGGACLMSVSRRLNKTVGRGGGEGRFIAP